MHCSVALYFKCLPGEPDIAQIEEYLLSVKKKNTTSSESFFKHTVYGLRFLFRTEGRDDRAIELPSIKRDYKLPVVLSRSEMKALLKVPNLLKHRVLIGLLLWLWSALPGSTIAVDQRCRLRTQHDPCPPGQKEKKDRYVPIGINLSRGLKTYLQAECPHKGIFNGKDPGEGFSQMGVQWAVRWQQRRRVFRNIADSNGNPLTQKDGTIGSTMLH